MLAFLLSPLLASFAYALLAVSAITMAPVLRQARNIGKLTTGANLELMSGTAKFLGGLKLAVSQNSQNNFVTEFEETLHDLGARQIAYTRQQTNRRLALATLSAVVGALAALFGLGVLDIAPAVVMTLLFILARINGRRDPDFSRAPSNLRRAFTLMRRSRSWRSS